MSKILAGLAVILLGALIFITFSGSGSAPALTFKSSTGEQLSLNLPKKPVLVTFWATTCPGCIASMPELEKLKNKLGDRFELLAISMDYDPAEQVDAFIKANPYPFVFIKDLDNSYSESFGGIKVTPTTYLIAPNGNIVYQKLGDTDMAFLEERIIQLSPQL